MRTMRSLSIPLIVLVSLVGPVVWAYPSGLPAFRAAGIIAGWAGCGLLLASLLLMLRAPGFASALGGLERMYRWHHRSGMAGYLLLLAHPLLLAADGLPDRVMAWQSLSPFNQGWPVWSGWTSLILMMAGLALTFDRRLRYSRWRWLHISLGLAVMLGLMHMLWLGIDEPVLPLLVLVLVLLGWRVVCEDQGWSARPYVVRDVRSVAAVMVEITLSPLGEPLRVRPGQFVLAAFFNGPGFRGCGEFHPFTVSDWSPSGRIRLGIKALGDCTQHLQSVEAGTQVRIDGAFGDFMDERTTSPQLWVAGGVGITPFLAVLRAGKLRQPTTLVYLYRQEADAAFVDELQKLADAGPLLTLKASATGNTLPDIKDLMPEAASLNEFECYLCGPPGLVSSARTVLDRLGVQARHIHFENFEFR